MLIAFLSARIRQYVLFALVLPVVGRLLEAVAPLVGARNARAGQLLARAGGYARRPLDRRQRRIASRALRRRRR